MNEDNIPEVSLEENIKALVNKVRPYFKRIINNKWKIIFVNVIFAVIVALYSYFGMKNFYVSEVQIFPDTRDKSMGSLAGLASLAGVSIPSGGGTSVEVFQNLLMSQTILSKVAERKYYSEELRDSTTLYKLFKIKPDEKYTDKEAQKRKMFLDLIEQLNKKITTEIDKPTKVLTVTATMSESKLSAIIVNNLVKDLDDYIRNQRKSYASNTRAYVEKRLKQVKDSLSYFENRLVGFRERNRAITLMAPNLMVDDGRIRRQIEILQNVYTELVKQVELAKIEEIKDIPVVNVKEYAGDPVVKAGPKRMKTVMTGTLIFLLFSLITTAFYPDIKKMINIVKNA